MKIRTGFVTNSSSYSSGVVRIESQKIVDLLKTYHSEETWFEKSRIFISNDEISTQWDEDGGSWENVPCSIDDVLDTLLDALLDVMDETFPALLNEVNANRKALTDSIQSVSWTCSDESYGEFEADDEERLCSYSFRRFPDGSFTEDCDVDSLDDSEGNEMDEFDASLTLTLKSGKELTWRTSDRMRDGFGISPKEMGQCSSIAELREKLEAFLNDVWCFDKKEAPEKQAPEFAELATMKEIKKISVRFDLTMAHASSTSAGPRYGIAVYDLDTKQYSCAPSDFDFSFLLSDDEEALAGELASEPKGQE